MSSTTAESTTASPKNAAVKTVRCSGTPYEIGFAHGSGAAEELRRNIVAYTAFYKDRVNLSWEEARERASTQFKPSLATSYPEILEEMKGIADGAGRGLVMEDILLINVRSEIGLTTFTDGCTCISQTGPDGTVFVAQNWDWIDALEHGLVFLHITPKDSPIEMKFVSEAGIVGKIGMNSAGLGVCLNAILSGAFDKAKLPVHIMIRRLLQFATTFDEAFAMIEDFGVASTINLTMGDKNGSHGSVECSPHGSVAILPAAKSAFPFTAHTNHLYSPNQPLKLKDHPEQNSFARLARLQELTDLDEANGVTPGFNSIRARLSDEQGTPDSICVALPQPEEVGMDRVTTLFTIIMELSAGVAKVLIGRPCDELEVLDLRF